MTDDASLQPVVAAEFLALADLLESVSDAQWDTSSLCEGWRVREVIAHMTMAARYPEEKFMAELRRCDFDFGRLSNEIASRDAGLPTSELIANLRSDTMQHWAPPGGGYHGALNHVVIHGLDVTVPLGVPRRSPDETIRIILDDLAKGDVHARFGTSIEGRRLQATDLDWSYGSGSPLRGAAEDLALVLCGRKLPPGRIEGDLPSDPARGSFPVVRVLPVSAAAPSVLLRRGGWRYWPVRFVQPARSEERLDPRDRRRRLALAGEPARQDRRRPSRRKQNPARARARARKIPVSTNCKGQ